MIEVDEMARSLGFFNITPLIWGHRLRYEYLMMRHKKLLKLEWQQINSKFIDALMTRKTPLGFILC
jgi:hypothetical protein